MTKDTQIKEALKRLEIMKKKGLLFHKPVIDTFKNGDIPMFENQGAPFRSVYYYLYGNKGQQPYDEIIEIKERFEKEYGALVYMVLISHLGFGTCYDFLYVSKQQDEWEMDIDDLNYGTPISYCHSDICEEFGSISIGYDKVCGGIYRNY